MLNKENWEETKRHFEAFWQQDYEERCNLVMHLPAQVRQEALLSVQPKNTEEYYTSPEVLYARWKNNALENRCLAEGLNSYCLYFGTAGHAAYFGAQPNYAPDTIWFAPLLEEPDAEKLHFDKNSPHLLQQKEIARTVAQKAKGEFLVGMTDNCGIIDALAQLRGPQNLLVDMLDNPEFVQEACKKITGAWEETQQDFFNILAENNEGGSTQGWMQLWCPGRHAQIQCDFSVMISPDMFEEFVLPEIESCSKFLDHTTYHLDGQEQIRHLDLILSVKELDNIQWTRVAGQPKVSTFIKELKKIQAAGKGLILIPEKEEIPFLLENLSHKGLHLFADAADDQEAEDIIRLAKRLAHA